jgi:hypothetical protein
MNTNNDHNLKFYAEREHIRQQNKTSAWQAEALEVDLLRARLSKTAAERDRLKKERLEFATLAVKAERERDQARDQVKTLLAACKRVGDRAMWRSLNGELVWRGETPDGNEIETQHPVSILQAAIASVESEESK